MNWREGFRRVARATAVCYALVACVAVVSVVVQDFSDSATSPLGPPVSTFTLGKPDSGHVRVRATSRKEASEIVIDHYRDMDFSALPPVGTVATVQSRYDRRITWLTALFHMGKMAGGWIAAYVALWLVFRGSRWIARGFLDGASA